MSNIDKQALIAKIKKQTESFDTVVLKEEEANALLDELEESERLRLKFQEANCELCQKLEAAEKRIAELEAREVKLTDINEYLADVHDKTLNRAFRLLAEGVRAGDVAALRAAGINVAAAGKGEAS